MPTQVHNSPMSQVRKVAKPLIDILNMYAEILHLMEEIKKVGTRLYILHPLRGEPIERNLVADLLNLGIDATHLRPLLARFAQKGSELGDKLARFGQGENAFFVHRALSTKT